MKPIAIRVFIKHYRGNLVGMWLRNDIWWTSDKDTIYDITISGHVLILTPEGDINIALNIYSYNIKNVYIFTLKSTLVNFFFNLTTKIQDTLWFIESTHKT